MGCISLALVMEDKVKALGLKKEHLKRQVQAMEEESLRREVSSLRKTLGHLGHSPSASSQQEVGGGHVGEWEGSLGWIGPQS